MQKKKLISIAIALTLQSYYIPAIAAENNDDEKECPSNISSLPKEKRAKLSPTCLATLPENDNHWGWVAGGVAALVAGVAIGVENNGGGDSTHSYTPPTPDNGGDVTPPDDGGDDNVIPPDDSGDDDVTPPDDSGDDDVTPPDDSGDDDVTPPDDSGDDDVTPPDDSGDDDVTPPDDSGDDDVTPPDDSGDDDVTPPDDSGDDDVTPPDDSGDDDVTPPDDSGDDDVTPPDDSGDDDDTPTDNSVTTFSNGVTIDKGKDTLAFDSFKLDNGSVLEGAVWNYSEQDDQWQLTTEDGKTLNVTGWDVTDANAAVIEGTQENGLYWKYDSRGYLIIADDNTTVITGDGESHTSDRGMDISGQDRTGVIISGDRTVNTLTGDSSVTDGATGMVISGDGTTNTISGHSTVDNAIGALISGNNTTTDFSGDITVSGGGTAIIIDGDNATVQNTGTSSISGAGSTGTTIDGNNARVSNDGDMTITDGATGGHIIGDNAVIDNVGDTTVSGAGSAALYVDGDNTLIINEGDQTISGGATGVNVSGDSNTVNIAGNVNMSAEFEQNSLIAGDTPLTGVTVNGANNDITLDGTFDINVGDLSTVSGQALSVIGLNVTGEGNNVDIRGGISITHSQNTDGSVSIVTGINLNGDSEVTLSGQSTIDTATMIGGAVTLAKVSNGGSLILDDNSIIDINVNYIDVSASINNALLVANGENSSIANQGDITSHGVYSIMRVDNGATIGNSGEILVYATSNGGGDDRTAVARADDAGSVIHNQSGGDITIISDQQPVKYKGFSFFPLKWYNHTFYAMLASGYGDVVNDKDAAIHLQGAGVYGVSAIKGAALNAGDIYLDGFVPTLDDEGDITSTSYWHPSSLYLTSAGMVAGSTDGGDGDATATNTGTINVNNAGFGMMALNGGTAINQGTINLTADEGVTKTDDNQLVGMAALNGGTVINDTTGTINIDASYGKPFYADDSSVVVNYGTICVADSCQNSSQYNPTDPMVSFAYNDGLLSAYGENIKLNNNILILGDVGNEGAVATEKVNVTDSGYLTNSASGEITSFVVAENGGKIDNRGKITSVDVEEGGTLTNSGDISDTLTVGGGASAINSATGSVNHIDMWKGSLDNQGYIGTLILQNTSGAVSNTGVIDVVNFKAATVFNNNGTVNDLAVASGATVNNLSGGVVSIPEQMWKGTLNNWGEVNGTMDIANGTFTFYNAGTFNGNIKTASAKGGMVENDGVINVTGNNVVAMSASGSAKMVNNGEINLGTKGTTDTGMIGMQLESNASSSAVIENNGTINIYASNSYAFSQLGSNGHIVNNGTVYIDDSVTGSGFIKQSGKTIEGSGENGDGTEVHYVDFIAPTEPTINDGMATVTTGDSAGSSTTNNLSGYVVGTSADGSAGKLKVSNASMNGVEINTGFAAGTADTTVSFDNVVEGSNLSDAGAIQSTTVVWNAQGSQDSDGNVDVTMTKNAYADVATDASVSGVASALDAGYTNNELYTSLNVGTTAELNNALKQVSGAQATTVFREARILSNRFNMLADAAPQIKDGLAFNVVAKGDPRAELGNDTQYDMLALRQKLDLTTSQNLTLEYGIARLDGDGSKTAGDNGLTGGYSQFFGLKHSMAFEEGLAWNNSLRYDVHNLDSSRSVSYGDTNKVADSDVRQQYLEFRSEGAKTFTLMSDTLKVTPYAGVKFRHTMEDGYKERSAGDFNLSMNSGNETAVDSLVGLKLDYAGKDGWSATATLEGGPNLSYSKSQRTASLQGAAGQSFGIDDGQKGGGVNGLATIGVKYSSNDTALHLDAYQWKEDGISDKGFMLNVKKTFR
ncbi:autotransporter adhesin BigA [Salmonella enterica]|nr:autotransporter adhesin BigA [Salmonella enterica]EHW0365520.1 autotransporter adhesin BigA [Salmonella enterica]EHW0411655.1 autotransporter adhesin BigA [Salmonella enterica]EHX5366136.1 autotransporter adhesin BigA [Salmonella enterica]EHY9951480.1 autotransporter adhesin BigA [Salmonella enterica]